MKDLDKEDIDTLQELGSLSTIQLMEKVKDLINLAYQLGLEECKNLFLNFYSILKNIFLKLIK